jgi:hypothetical protein
MRHFVENDVLAVADMGRVVDDIFPGEEQDAVRPGLAVARLTLFDFDAFGGVRPFAGAIDARIDDRRSQPGQVRQRPEQENAGLAAIITLIVSSTACRPAPASNDSSPSST